MRVSWRALALLWALPLAVAGEPLSGPAQDYALHCSACHGLDGRGAVDWVPTLHGLGDLVAAPEGRAYLVRVPGVAQSSLDDARLARLLDWVLERFSGSPPSPPFSAEEVGALRRTPLRDPRAARAALR